MTTFWSIRHLNLQYFLQACHDDRQMLAIVTPEMNLREPLLLGDEAGKAKPGPRADITRSPKYMK